MRGMGGWHAALLMAKATMRTRNGDTFAAIFTATRDGDSDGDADG